MPLIIGGDGINVYRPVYRDGAPISTVAERRAALQGFAAGAFRISDLADAAIATIPEDVDLQIQAGGETLSAPTGSSRTRPGRRSRSPTEPGSWSSATRAGPMSRCRC